MVNTIWFLINSYNRRDFFVSIAHFQNEGLNLQVFGSLLIKSLKINAYHRLKTWNEMMCCNMNNGNFFAMNYMTEIYPKYKVLYGFVIDEMLLLE